MFRNIWKGKQAKKRAPHAIVARYRGRSALGLRLEPLEGRTMLSGAGVGTDPTAGIATDAATHLAIFAPPMVLAGSVVPVEVVALDANNQPTSGFTDSISLGSSDSTALVSIPSASAAGAGAGTAVPFSYTFQSSNDGHQLFFVTFGADTSGDQTLTATDTTDTSIVADTVNTTVNTPAAATHFAVIVSPNVTVGAPANLFVEALDADNHVVPNYEGTVTLSSSDAAATLNTDNGPLALPQTYTFTAADHGRHRFDVTFNTAGAATTISADDAADSLTGTGTTNVNPPAVATHFAVWIPPTTLAGVPTTVFVLALDANNHIVPNYTGPVTFSVSNDPSAVLPAGYTFQASDHGHTTFQVTFDTDGPQTVTVADVNDQVTGAGTTTVVPAPVTTQFLVILPPSAPAGVPVQGFVVRSGRRRVAGAELYGHGDVHQQRYRDRGNGAGGLHVPAIGLRLSCVHGRVRHAWAAVGDGDRYHDHHDDGHGLDHGDGGRSPNVAPDRRSAEAPVGVPIVVQVQVLDADGNPIPDFAGQITLTSSDTAATIVPLSSVLPGGIAFEFVPCDQFGTSGSQTLTATDGCGFADRQRVGERDARIRETSLGPRDRLGLRHPRDHRDRTPGNRNDPACSGVRSAQRTQRAAERRFALHPDRFHFV